MHYEYLLWICLFAYACHIVEETILDWKSWAEATLGFKNLQWSDFFVTNAAVIAGGISMAMVGWRLPAFALAFPALQIINGIFFHIVPTIKFKRFSPGFITSCILFLPIGIWTFFGAWQDGVLFFSTLILSFVFGALLMATPIVFLLLKGPLGIKTKYK